MFSTEERCIYNNNQLAEVICQLRFPEILAINANIPVDFQEAIRAEYPRYSVKKESAPHLVSGAPGNLSIEHQPATPNYQFVSSDGFWRINLTSKFISLSCTKYKSWEEYANHFDNPLTAFIKIYNPAYFERVGLRYLNFISRQCLGLNETPFSELIQPQYLGILSDEEISENTASRSSVDAEVAIRGGCRVKLHAGPGMVKVNGQSDNEIKYIFDHDLFMSGNVPINYSAGALQTLHSQAYPLFRGAITDILHNAMNPEPIE